MKKIQQRALILFATLLISLCAHADWQFGVGASYDNTGAAWTVNEERYSTRNVSGFSVGPMVAYQFIDYFSVQSGLLFSMNGFGTTDKSFFKNIAYVTQETVRLYYLQLPIYAVGQYPVRNDAILLLEAGPMLGCGVFDQVEQTNHVLDSNLGNYSKETNVVFGNALSRFNAAMHIGIGAQYMGARLMVGYNFGLFDMAVKEDTTLRSGGFTVSIGYMF